MHRVCLVCCKSHRDVCGVEQVPQALIVLSALALCFMLVHTMESSFTHPSVHISEATHSTHHSR